MNAGEDAPVAAAQGGGNGVPERAVVAAQNVPRRLDQRAVVAVRRRA